MAETFQIEIDQFEEFLQPPRPEEARSAQFRFMFLSEKRHENAPYIEYCLLHKSGRFIRLLDAVTSSVDIREAAHHIVSTEPEDRELEIIWDGNMSNKQFYLVRDYCPPLYGGPLH